MKEIIILNKLKDCSDREIKLLAYSSNKVTFADDDFVRTFCNECFGDVTNAISLQLNLLYPILCKFLFEKHYISI